MTWSRLDDQARNHPKMKLAQKRLNKTRKGRGDAAMAMWVQAIIYCNEAGTDGYIPADVLDELTCDPEPALVANVLADASVREGGCGLFEREDGGAFRVHDFLEFNPSAKKVREEKEAAKRRAEASRAAHVRRTEGARTAHEGDGAAHVRSTYGARTENVQSTYARAPGPGRARTGPGSVSASDSSEGVQGEPDETDLRKAFIGAVASVTARTFGGIPNFGEESEALGALWADARGEGATFEEFRAGLVEHVRAWFAEGSKLAKAPWNRPSVFEHWLRSKAEAAASRDARVLPPPSAEDYARGGSPL